MLSRKLTGGVAHPGARSADRVASSPLTRLLSAADSAVRIPPAGGAVASGVTTVVRSGPHAAQAAPREVGELVGQGGWVGLAVRPQPMDAGALDHADDAAVEQAEGVAVFVDEAEVGGETQLDHLVA